MIRYATPKQIAFINTLAGEKDRTALPLAHTGLLDTLEQGGDVTIRDASALIDALKAAPYPRATTPASTAAANITSEGMYIDGNGGIYKVVTSRNSGRLYAKRLTITDPNCDDCADGETARCIAENGKACPSTSRFVYAPGGVARLGKINAVPLTLDQATAIGYAHGFCACCARELTDPKSVAAGIGPVCAKKLATQSATTVPAPAPVPAVVDYPATDDETTAAMKELDFEAAVEALNQDMAAEAALAADDAHMSWAFEF